MTRSVRAPQRIALVTSLLGGGGAERILVTMAEWWAQQGRTVAVFVLREDESIQEYPLPLGIEVRRLRLIAQCNPLFGLGHFGRLATLRREILRFEPDVVVSFLDKLNVAVLLALEGSGRPVIATEHLAPWRNPLGRGWEMLRRLSYRRAAMIISPTKRITDHLQNRMKGRFATLPSPANLRFRDHLPGGGRRAVITAVGRLVPQKGFDQLIEAAADLLVQFPTWRIEILGEGPERPDLEKRARESGLAERVRLLGAVSDPQSFLATSAVFVLSSRHEAYPMALCEAMAAGCAVVATDCPTGPREILGDPLAGLLVEPDNPGALVNALARVLADPIERERLAGAACERARDLSAEVIMPAWDAALTEATGR